jgi:tetratricopeptide (TPR) repeat protein
MSFGFWKTPSFDERWEELKNELRYFLSVIGGYPPKVKTQAEVQQVKKRWENARKLAEGLLKEKPDNIQIKLALGELFRMGRNIDIPNAVPASDKMLKEVIKVDPNNFQAYYSLASMYVTLNPKFAPDAEVYFLKAEQLASPKVVPDIYQGLGFACLYQGKTNEAIAYFEKYLGIIGGNDAGIQTIVKELKSGKKPQFITQ